MVSSWFLDVVLDINYTVWKRTPFRRSPASSTSLGITLCSDVFRPYIQCRQRHRVGSDILNLGLLVLARLFAAALAASTEKETPT